MQIIWVSGPVGHIRKINLTYRHLLIGAFGISLSFLVIGAALQYLGFRMAIEYDPQLAKKLGNLHSPVEIDNLNALYKLKLLEVNNGLADNQEKLRDLELINKKLELLATPPTLRSANQQQVSVGGKFIPLDLEKDLGNARPLKIFSKISVAIDAQERQMDALIKHNKSHLEWLESKPTGIPIQSMPSVSSEFGPRIDPFNQRESFHSGVDFQSPSGTPIAASANGRVLKAGWDSNYGQLLIVDHGDGFLSRYAHARDVYVKEGELVKRNQVIATVGTSGRSTGPHLHYEIVKNGQSINPKGMIVGLNGR